MKVCREPDYLSVMHEMNLSRSGTVVIFDNDNHTAARLRKYYDPEDLMFGDDIYLEDLYSSDEAVIKFSLGDTMLWYDSSYDNLLSRHLTFDVSYMLGYYVEVCGLSDYEAKLKILNTCRITNIIQVVIGYSTLYFGTKMYCLSIWTTGKKILLMKWVTSVRI